jgi:hypothetical protein
MPVNELADAVGKPADAPSGPGALVIGPNVRGGFGGGVAPDHHSRRFCAAEDATTCPGPTR